MNYLGKVAELVGVEKGKPFDCYHYICTCVMRDDGVHILVPRSREECSAPDPETLQRILSGDLCIFKEAA